MLHITVLDRLTVTQDGVPLDLPPSRKTRALLGYLLMQREPVRRGALIEIFWDVPDDPRAALRWSLSKLRGVLNADGVERLRADQRGVQIVRDDLVLDIDLAVQTEGPEGWDQLNGTLLGDCEIPKLPRYAEWLAQERAHLTHLRSGLARQLALSEDLPAEDRPRWALRWLDQAPNDPEAASCAIAAYRALGQTAEAEALSQKFTPRDEAPNQTVRFARAQDGTTLAWASVGAESNPTIIKAANWLTHLDLDWRAPIWSPLFRDLARDHQVIRYDERGCGLSDWEVPEISLDSFVSDLELVVEASGAQRFALLGISQGAAVSIEYAARYPERVSQLILFGGYPAGWRLDADEEETREREAVMVLTETGWGRSDPIYRHLFSQTFMPDATVEELNWFDEFQRQTTSPENAARFLEAFSRIDVRHRLAEVKVPTLVIHSRDDCRIPLATGRSLAAEIPGAEFLPLESPNHLLIGREPAAGVFLGAVRDFIARTGSAV